MQFYRVFILMSLLGLAACADLNGSASGSHRGGSAHSEIFKIRFPP